MATVALGAVRAAPDSTKFLLLGAVVLGGGFLWYNISTNPLGQMISKWSGFALNPLGFVENTFKYGFSTFTSTVKECNKGGIAQKLGCGVGGAGKGVFGFFQK